MDDEIPIPKNWPNWETAGRFVQHDPVEVEVSSIRSYREKAHLSEVYPMTKKIRGRCLLLMNAEFPSRLAHETGQLADDFYTKRQGTYPDIRCMSELFQSLGFIVVKRINKTAKEMEEYLEMERHNSYHEVSECFVCVISSYGTQRHVFGKDGGKMTYRSILQKFDDFHCPALKGKPKLFFWQTNSGTEFLYKHRDGPISKDEAQRSLGFVPWTELPPDMLLLLPNIPGFHSLMLIQGGILFQTVVYIFERWAYKHDIQTLLSAVARLARQFKAGGWFRKSGGAVLAPIVYSTLKKKLYFFPGQYEIDNMEPRSNIPEEIRDMPADALDLYLKILETGVERRRSIRLMLVGLYAAGKTSLARRLMGQNIENIESTNGIDIHKGRCTVSLEDGTWSVTNAETENDPASRLAALARGHSNDESSQEATPEDQNDRWNDEVVSPIGPLPERRLTTKISDVVTRYEYIFALAVVLIACLYMMGAMTVTSKWFWTILGSVAILFLCLLVIALRIVSNREMEIERRIQFELTFSAESDGAGNRQFLTAKNSEQLRNMRRIIEKSSSRSPSKRKNVTVSIWDFAGQFVYYSTHQLFLSPRAVYIVVLKLTKDLMDYIADDIWFMDARGKRDLHIHAGYRFWLRSLYNYGGGSADKGNVIFVGTHKDKLQGSEEERTREIKNYFDGIGQLLQGNAVTGMVNDKKFAVNNLEEDNSIPDIRKTILEVAKSQTHWNEELPAKWIQLEDLLMDERGKGKFILTFDEIVMIDRSCPAPIYDTRQLKLFLTYQTRLGNLVYYDQEPIQDTVVLDPQWIVNAFCSLVADVRSFKTFGEPDEDWVKMTKTGIMDESLPSRIWRKKGDKSYVKYQKELLTYMEKLNVIAKVRMILEASKKEKKLPKYFIPCLLRNAPDKRFLSGLLEKNSKSSPVLCFVFEKHFLPPSVFHRLLAACVARWAVSRQGSNYLMFCGCGVFDLTTDATRHRLTILHLGDVIAMIISVVSLAGDDLDRGQCDRARRFIETTLKNEFRRFRSHIYTGRDDTISNKARCEVKERSRGTNDEATRTPFKLRILCPDIEDICLAAEQEGLISVEELVSAYKEGQFSCVEHSDRNCPHLVRVNDVLKDWFPDKVGSGVSPVESVINRLQDFQDQDIPLTDKLMSRIAACIGKGWERLGSELNLSIEIDHVREDFPHDTRNQIFQMLKTWKQKVDRKATLKKLIRKITLSQCRVDEDRLKNAIEGIDTT
ncbi:hypothetical protein CHS0354_002953 [Potamilus streckersoni]|uniref:non-specific serine/threonine protein kinase n=1 Tax=Potamilus streckersoni TaxID=2493646 RepID=A0AAE0RS61_9BIVA|nr:hypothetical protein CHS0354_002953 [Potamilus streckersoni]